MKAATELFLCFTFFFLEKTGVLTSNNELFDTYHCANLVRPFKL